MARRMLSAGMMFRSDMERLLLFRDSGALLRNSTLHSACGQIRAKPRRLEKPLRRRRFCQLCRWKGSGDFAVFSANSGQLCDLEDARMPVLYNTWKHDAESLRRRIAACSADADLAPLASRLVVVGTDLMDLYTGSLQPA